jgi:phytoene synthase
VADTVAAREDVRACRQIIHVHARSFSFASRFLPRKLRDDVAVVYGYYRYLDDLVDLTPPGMTEAHVRDILDDWEAWLRGGAPHGDAHPVRRALPDVIARRQLRTDDLAIVIEGLRADLGHVRPATLAQLEVYAFDVAGSVGVVMADILGAGDRDAARPAAAALGTAMQLTNICRDVAEDLRHGRVYLPVDVCQASGCANDDLLAGSSTPGVRAAVACVAGRARQLYALGVEGLPLLPRETRFPIAVAARAYAAILDRLAARDHDVFAGRVAVSRRDRLAMAARLAAGRALGG